jgi:hypothetical protein
MALAQYSSLKHHDLNRAIHPLGLVADPDYGKLGLIPFDAAVFPLPATGSDALLPNLIQDAVVQGVSVLRGE